MAITEITYKRKCAWNFRQLEGWTEKDFRYGEGDVLVWHPVVTKLVQGVYSKQWQPAFFDGRGRIAGQDVTLVGCARKEAIMTRNIGNFGKGNYFRAYTGSRASVGAQPSSSGKKTIPAADGWKWLGMCVWELIWMKNGTNLF